MIADVNFLKNIVSKYIKIDSGVTNNSPCKNKEQKHVHVLQLLNKVEFDIKNYLVFINFCVLNNMSNNKGRRKSPCSKAVYNRRNGARHVLSSGLPS